MTSSKRQASQEVNRGLAIGQQLGRWFVQSLTFKMFSPLAFPSFHTAIGFCYRETATDQ